MDGFCRFSTLTQRQIQNLAFPSPIGGKAEHGSDSFVGTPRQQSGLDACRIEARLIFLTNPFGHLPPLDQIDFDLRTPVEVVADQRVIAEAVTGGELAQSPRPPGERLEARMVVIANTQPCR